MDNPLRISQNLNKEIIFPLSNLHFRRWVVCFVVAIGLSVSVPMVMAHGYLVRAIPEDRATLERMPPRLQFWFSEALEPKFSTIQLLNQAGEWIADGQVSPQDDALLVLQPPNNLPNGAYIVVLRPAFASDGHVITENRVFFVGEAVEGVEVGSSVNQAPLFEVLWRAILLSSSTLLFGMTILYTRILIPAWGNVRYRAGKLPPRLMNRLTFWAGVALLGILLGNGLAIIQYAMSLFDVGAATVLRNNLWQTARLGSRFGDVWTFRMVLWGLIVLLWGLTLYWRTDKPRTVLPFWHAMMWASALMVGTFAASSHAAGSLVMPWVAVLVHWLHTVAVSVWVGGLVAFTLILPSALQPYQAETRHAALLVVLKRFSVFAFGAALITVLSGIYSATLWLESPQQSMTSPYGLALWVKVALVAGVLAVSVVHHLLANPSRYAWAQPYLAKTEWVRWSFPLESVLALAVLVGAGWLGATPPPPPSLLQQDFPTPRATQTGGNYTLDLTVSPGGIGVNTVDVRLRSNETSLPSDAQVRLQWVRPSLDWRSAWQSADSIDDGNYLTVGDEVDSEGEWLLLVDVFSSDGASHRFAQTWQLTDQASILKQLPPRWVHGLALGMLMLGGAWVLKADLKRFMQRMNLNAVTASIILTTVLITVIALGWGFQFIFVQRDQARSYDNPLPLRVNPTLPDEASLARGEAIFNEACAEWQTYERVLQELQVRLPRTRDEELYAMVTTGWRGLPSCLATADEVDIWHTVNYLRTWEHLG